MKLPLREVTLCVADCLNPQLALQAIEKSQQGCEFHSAILFTDQPMPHAQGCKIVPIRTLQSIHDYSRFMLRELAPHIDSRFALIIQWDGYVIDPKAWNAQFFDYDYIGAKWPWHQDGMNVGNGGFSLRSKKLLEATSSSAFDYLEGVNEDDQICRHHRHALIGQHSIRFAPVSVADQFSYEYAAPDTPTFGFHGLFNMWRHCTDDDMLLTIAALPERTCRTSAYLNLMLQYFDQRKFKPMTSMYLKIRRIQSLQDFSLRLLDLTHNQDYTNHAVQVFERLLQDKRWLQTVTPLAASAYSAI